MAEKGIKVIVYEKLEDCMAKYLNCDPEEVNKGRGHWEWRDKTKKDHRISHRRALKNIQKLQIWAFLDEKEFLHIWIGEGVRPREVVGVLAHEIGHSKRPWYRDHLVEEYKTSCYESVALMAVDLMCDLIGREL